MPERDATDIPTDDPRPTTLRRASLLSFYYCSAYGFHSGSRLLSNGDIARVGGCS